MSDVLKRIEERHRPIKECRCKCSDGPCDLVKLARALDEEVRRQEVNKEREKRGLPFLYNPEAERALREVAGENP